MDVSDALIQLAADGDRSARQELLTLYRARLKRMVAMRIDPRVSRRFDPSDVVQETLLTAEARLDDYLENQPVSFYPWLRKIAWERLVKLHRLHVHTQQRSVVREDLDDWALSEDSVNLLVDRLADNLPTPSENMVRSEVQRQVQSAITALPQNDRAIIELLYLEQMKTGEVADTLEVSTGSVRVRHFRAIQRLCRLLKDRDTDES